MNYLNSLKENYLKVTVPTSLKANGWESVLFRISESEPVRLMWYEAPLAQARRIFLSLWSRKSFAFALASILIFVGGLFGLYKVAQAAVPGEPFYPVKRLAEGIFVKATGNKEIVTQNRAQEIVDLAKKKEDDTKRLNQTVTEYVKAVDEVKKESVEPKSGFEHKLEEQHKQFDEVSHDHPEIESNLQEAVHASEVKPSGD